MARYIDADKIVNGLREAVERMRPNDNTKEIIDIFCEGLQNEPAADIEEVKHGEWIPVQYTYFGLKRYECSECKDDEYWQKRYIEHKEKYCPNCGAKMDERRDT